MSSPQPAGGVPPPPPDLPLTTRSRGRLAGSGAAVLLLLIVVGALAASTAILAGNPTPSSPASPATDSAAGPSTIGSALPTTEATAGSSPAPPAETASPAASPAPTAPSTASPDVKEAPPTSAPPEELTGYVWPLRDARITSRFGERDFGGFVVIDGREIHDGLDLATYCGNKIRAAHDGTVLYAGRRFDDYMGYLGSGSSVYQRLERQGRLNTLPIVIVIDDGNGYRSVYVHLSKANVEAGDIVEAGDVIGLEGMTGYATGCHLHYSLVRMDGPWQVVVPQLHPYGYPPFARERVDPLRVLPKDHPDAPARLRNRFATPSPQSTSTPFATPPPAASGSPSQSPVPSP